ncbi:hypothetical protein [Actinoallomurus iriomotensis]|uniref:Uncharacterized protein n=1 Tax=Actinoallomurus iriomotensis TaxID=478107 RepID=A0A9W6RYM6_9ACTN|nr:hypothetical protein [Actinoallomurus iriomotensis]GLY85181.1 hypothetical protein Airi02_031100 [Actinoallomurus iriomotensis]
MPTLRDFLRRWRPAVAPGAAARTGVPADRPAGPAEELMAVFRALEPVHAECRAIGDAARHDASAETARARERAEAIVAEARAAAPARQREAMAEARARSAAENAAVITEAERQADDIRRLAAERMPEMIDKAVGLLERELR